MSISNVEVKAEKLPIYLKDYTVPDFHLDHVHLNFVIEAEHTLVRSELQVRRNTQGLASAPLWLDGDELELVSVEIDGHELSTDQYELTETGLSISSVPDAFLFSCVVRSYPDKNTTLMGLYQSGGNLCTQCEPHGFRRITYFLDRPDVMTRFTTTITACKKTYPHLLANGNLVESRDLDDGRHWVKWVDPSLKPCYLFALVAGQFDVLTDSFKTMSGREVVLRFFLERGYGEQGKYALAALKRSMKWDEEAYGREYDLDIFMVVAVSDFNFGAMENKGLNIFNTSCVLASQDRATDDDFIRVEDVVGHEYFHNWSGNRITCRDWFQLTLKEGLTVFRDQCFSEDMTRSEIIRLQEVALVRTAQFAEDASPLAHPIRPASYLEMNNFYTHTVYRKGAEVIRMLHTMMGEGKFRQAMDLYFERFDGQAVTTDDFLSVMVETDPSIDLQAFLVWYEVAGTPIISVTDTYDADQQTYTLHIEQSLRSGLHSSEITPERPFYFPLSMALFGKTGQTIALQLDGESESTAGSRVMIMNAIKQSLVFKNVTEKPVPSLLRRFSAPVELRYDYSDEDLFLLWQHDSDAFVRDLSRQEVLTRLLLQAADAQAAGQEMVVPDALLAVFDHLLKTQAADANIQAQLLMMPTAQYVLQKAQGRNLDHIMVAYKHFRSVLAIELKDQWLQCYESFPVNAYEPDVVSMGARRVRSACLQGMTGSGGDEGLACAFSHLKSSDNMTDSINALAALNDHDGRWRDDAMQSFLSEWESEPLVLCKWFSMVALKRDDSVLSNVQELVGSTLFDWTRPNYVMALLGAFTRNWWGFHRADGKGYALIETAVKKLNSINPQVAARLVRPLSEWQSLDEGRQQKMRETLRAIAAIENVSPDVYEIASKSA